MKILAIYQSTGHGSGEFKREAEKAADVWVDDGHTVSLMPVRRHFWRPWKMRKAISDAIVIECRDDNVRKFDAVAFFCHGTWKHLKLGWNVWNVGELASLLGSVCSRRPKIILYACSCGRGKFEKKARWALPRKHVAAGFAKGFDGFAFMLADAFDVDCIPRVYAHSAAGHTTKNPYMFDFYDVVNVHNDEDKHIDRTGVIWKTSPNWHRWFKLMRSESSTLRYRFPFMSDVELERELER